MAVYLITARSVGLVKIGYTEVAVTSRFHQINSHSPVEVVLEGEVDGGREAERSLHDLFAEYRIRGEWFTLCPEIEDLIAANRIAPPEKPTAEPGTADAIICKFGSAAGLARALGVPMTTVASWRQKNVIPHWRRDALKELAGQHGFALSDEEFPA